MIRDNPILSKNCQNNDLKIDQGPQSLIRINEQKIRRTKVEKNEFKWPIARFVSPITRSEMIHDQVLRDESKLAAIDLN